MGRLLTASHAKVESLPGLIEVDAGIQPGDSGGPLADAAGLLSQMPGADSLAPNRHEVELRPRAAV